MRFAKKCNVDDAERSHNVILYAFLNSDLHNAEKRKKNISINSPSANAMLMFVIGVFHTIPCFVVFGSMKQNSAGFSDAR